MAQRHTPVSQQQTHNAPNNNPCVWLCEKAGFLHKQHIHDIWSNKSLICIGYILISTHVFMIFFISLLYVTLKGDWEKICCCNVSLKCNIDLKYKFLTSQYPNGVEYNVDMNTNSIYRFCAKMTARGLRKVSYELYLFVRQRMSCSRIPMYLSFFA